MERYLSHSPEETMKIAARFAQKLRPGDVVAYRGGMGAGKTAFTRGVVSAFGDPDQVSSPTFALVHEYATQPVIWHFDMYRVENFDDLYSTGFFDYLEQDGILLIEWSENVEGALPEDTVRVAIHIPASGGEDDREISIEGDDSV